ncbi:MAG: YggS family pyridoxal phosphate-dependent enzyme [Actinomycetes bacterium]
MTEVPDTRRQQIAAGLTAARERIHEAEAVAGRAHGSVGLVVVTKTFPAEEVAVLADLGVRHVGENRDQEAAPKARELHLRDLVWHFIGQLQSNKTKSVARYASVVESVDRPRVIEALNRSAVEAGRGLDCLIQVSLDDEPGRGGAAPSDVPALAEQIEAAPGLQLRGVMAVAPLPGDPDAAFARLEVVAVRLRAEHPEAGVVSAGMSADLEAAVRHGATHVRLGSAILGYRPPVR